MKCSNCNHEVEINHRFCGNCGNAIEVISTLESKFNSDISINPIDNKILFFKKNPLALLATGVTGLIIVVFIFWNVRYSQLIDQISWVSVSGFSQIENSFWGLPDSFRDVGKLKEDFDYIQVQSRLINGGNNQDYRSMREAYFRLNEFNVFNNKWGLYPLLDARRDRALYGNWRTSCFSTNTNYFNVTAGSNGPLVGTNLPTRKNSTQSYYYYETDNWKTIGYENQNNSSDKFEAFKIVSVSEGQMRISNLQNNLTYQFSHCGY
jgi:hypothetical protein